MPSLAGRPPYATDEPDSAYQSGDNKRRRNPPPARTQQKNNDSVYDVYDNYLEPGSNAGQNRNSGVGAAFMNGLMDDDSDSEDEDRSRNYTRKPMDPHHTPVSIPVPQPAPPPTGKNAALAAAAAAAGHPRSDPTPPPVYRQNSIPNQPPPAAIAAPRPGYAAPINQLNNTARGQVPPGIQVPRPQQDIGGPQASPSPTSPHPLQAPITPIQPVFARPRPPKNTDVKFEGDVMRGGKEESMIPKRGEKGDDFWRRFSMVVKDEGSKREKVSPWLRKTTSGTSSFARWVWVIGIILVIAAAGGIGLGWYISHKNPDHQQPVAIGGSANEAGSVSASSVKAVGSGGATAKSSLHVTPTNTVARREDEMAYITASPRAWMEERAPVPTDVVHIEPEISWMNSKRDDANAQERREPADVVHIEPEISFMNGKRDEANTQQRREPADVVHIEPEISWMSQRREESSAKQRRHHAKAARQH